VPLKRKDVIDGLEILETGCLYYRPSKPEDLIDPWLRYFFRMERNQFLFAVNQIIRNEEKWPPVSMVFRYAEIWPGRIKKERGPTESKGPRKIPADIRERLETFFNSFDLPSDADDE